METINYPRVEEVLYKETLSNGLEIYLIPNKNVKNFYMTFSTKFGSLYTEFKKATSASYTKIPDGVAHFLEHITFKMPDGDASDYFANLGSESNAYTSFKVTCYEVYGFDKFKENLNYLLDFVQTPCYTAKMIEAEKGIIAEEVKMCEDNPLAILSYSLYRNLFSKYKYSSFVCGNVKDVKSTTLKDIENSYQTFYHPSNMFIIITGNFNHEEALAIIEENQSKKEFGRIPEIKIKRSKEPNKVVKEYEEIPANVEVEKVNIGLKIPLNNFSKLNISDIKRDILINIIVNSNFGRTSEIRERLISGNIITDGIVASKYITEDYLIIELAAETPYPQRYINIMKEKLKNITITKDELERKKRVAISNYILSFDDIEENSYNIQSDIINYGQVHYNIYDIYNELEFSEALEVAKKINDKNMAIVVLIPKKDK